MRAIDISSGQGDTGRNRSKFLRPLLIPSVLVFLAIGASACLFGSSQSPAQKASVVLAQGIAAQKAGSYVVAGNDYLACLKFQPGNKFCIYDLGTLYQIAYNNCTAAENEYHQVLAIDPNNAAALFNLAICETPNSPAEAVALYKQVVAIQPTNAPAFLNLGFAEKTIGEVAAGQAAINKAYRLQPSLRPTSTTTTLPGTGTTATTTTIAKATTST